MAKDEGRMFGAVEYTEEDAAKDWRALGREELISRVIVALDGAKMAAEEEGDENYVRHVDAVLFPFLERDLEDARERRMTKEERELYDAQADHEAWDLAWDILEPWVKTAEPIGSDELTQVMREALAKVEGELGRTLDVLEALREGSQA